MAYDHPKIEEAFFEYELGLEKAIDHLVNEFAAVKAGRANPRILDKITVDYYDTPTPINQIAGISVPEARMIVIAPWDVNTIKLISKAITASDIGLTPNDDGKVIRLIFPQLTEERRKEIVKSVKKLAEDAKIAGRGHRRDAIEVFKKLKKDSEISEDLLATLEKEVQKKIDEWSIKVDKILAEKEKEVLTV